MKQPTLDETSSEGCIFQIYKTFNNKTDITIYFSFCVCVHVLNKSMQKLNEYVFQ